MKAAAPQRSAGRASRELSCSGFCPAARSTKQPVAATLWRPRLPQQPLRLAAPSCSSLRASRRDGFAHRRTVLHTAALLTAVPHQVPPAAAAPPQVPTPETAPQLNGSLNGSSSGDEEPSVRNCRPANPPLRITTPGRVVAGQRKQKPCADGV